MPQKFNNSRDILAHYHLAYRIAKFIDLENTPPASVSPDFKEELDFALVHRGEPDK